MTPSRSTASLIGLLLLAACAGGQDGGPSAASGGAGGSAAAAAARSPAAKPAAAAGQDCRAPLPGHPTLAERRAFVADVGRLASEAERRHGVPAAAVAAIAIQESGYGWTPLAQNTNNILAWKWTTPDAAGGRGFWVLECPAQGTADRFVRFRDRAEAVDFVAARLASSDNYGADTERYRRARADGAAATEAVDAWVGGVADPYSTDPEAWQQAIRRVMNDPLNPSDRRSAGGNLYRLSEQAPAQVRPGA